MVCSQDAELPELSVAVQVRIIVLPSHGSLDCVSVYVSSTSPQLSTGSSSGSSTRIETPTAVIVPPSSTGKSSNTLTVQIPFTSSPSRLNRLGAIEAPPLKMGKILGIVNPLQSTGFTPSSSNQVSIGNGPPQPVTSNTHTRLPLGAINSTLMSPVKV